MRRALLVAAGLLHAAIVCACALRHEPWFDEAQSWLLARDSNPIQLLALYSRYEGSPALWQMLLMPLIWLGLPYSYYGLVSAGLAITGVVLFLRFAPFPWWLRCLFPFTYFPLYQYSVVARSYALLLPILAVLAALFPSRSTQRPVLYAAFLVLLANVSLHGALLAAVLIAEWIVSAVAGGVVRSHTLRFGCIVAVFVLLYGLLLLELRLPADLMTVGHDPARFAGLNRALTQIDQAFFGAAESKLLLVLGSAAAALTLGFTLFCFRVSRPAILLVLTLTPLLALAAFRQSALWHSGIVFLVWIFCLWIHFGRHPQQQSRLAALITLVFAVQTYYGIRSILFDWDGVYSGSLSTARYLKAAFKEDDALFAIGFKAFAVQPYFERNRFAAQESGRREAFYSWTQTLSHASLDVDVLDRLHPAAVVLSKPDPQPFLGTLADHGYCTKRRFDGGIWWKTSYAEPDTYFVLTPCSAGNK